MKTSYNTLLFLPLLVLGVSFIYLLLFRSESAVQKYNNVLCLKHRNNEYKGIVIGVGKFKKSKIKLIILKDSTFIVPLGLNAPQLNRISVGDSIIKKKKSRTYIVFSQASVIDSFIIEPYYGNNCSN